MYRLSDINGATHPSVTMKESRTVPSGKIYRHLFDAQVQLSRSLLAGRKDTRTDCLSADSNTQCSTASRLCSSSSRGHQVDDVGDVDDDVDDVHQLPANIVVTCPSSDIIDRLAEKKQKNHNKSLKQMDAELTKLAKACEAQIRLISEGLLSFLLEVDLRLDILKDRMDPRNNMEHDTLQDVCGLWEQVEEEMKLKRMQVMETNQKLTNCEMQRANKIRAVVKKYCHLLEKISFLLPHDVHRLIHSEATMLNQSLLANRRSLARLRLLLQEEILQQESLLHLHWEHCLSHWRKSKVTEVLDHFRSLCSSDEDQQLIQVQQTNQYLHDLTKQRCDLISRISSLVPPICSTALVSDWYNQLTAVNQQIDSFHNDFLCQLRSCYEQTWQQRLAEVEHCKEALSALQLSVEDVNEVVSSQLIPLIGQFQRWDEERLAALDLYCDSVSRHALGLSCSVFAVMRGAAFLWETHRRGLEKREEEVQQQLNDLRCSQLEHIQGKKMVLEDMLAGLRQESNEEALKTSLKKTVLYLQDIKDSYRLCLSEQWELLDRLPSLFLDELLSYSSSLSSFYHLKHTYSPSPEELQRFHLSVESSILVTSENGDTCKPGGETDNYPISHQNDANHSHCSKDCLIEAESSIQELYDISNNMTFQSSSHETYTGPAFRCSISNLQDKLQQETQLSLFPVELLTHTLNRTRTLFLDKLEQSFHDVLSLSVSMVKDRKEAVSLDQELQLQLLDPQHIQTHVYQARLDELQLHRHCVEVHCSEVQNVLTSCRTELKELKTSISTKNSEFTIILSKMETDILTSNSSQRLETASSTLQECLDHHIQHTQSCQTEFRQTVQTRLERVKIKTAELLSSFRLFSEGGDLAPQELKVLQKRLKEETKHISVTEQNISSELEMFESKSLQQVKKVSDKVEEKLSLWMSELKFKEKIEEIMSSTRIQIRAEAAKSNRQQSLISSRLDNVKRTMEEAQVSPDQVLCLVSSIGEDLKRRHQYLEFEQEAIALLSPPKSASSPAPRPPSTPPVSVPEDPAADIIKFLNRLSLVQEGTLVTEDRETGQSPVHRLQKRRSASLSSRRSIRADRSRRFQIFGAEPEKEPQCFLSIVNSLLWKTNSVLLSAAEDFYQSERHSKFHLLPDTLDQWAENEHQRLIGYQEQAAKLTHMSRKTLLKQQMVFKDLVHSLPSVLIHNYEQEQDAGLIELVGGVTKKLKEHLAESEQEKKLNVQRLKVSLGEDELQTVVSREEERQQRVHNTICSSHLELQGRVQERGREFVTSLASLTEKLFTLLDDLHIAAEFKSVSKHQPDNITTMETAAEAETGSRTWPGIPYLWPTSNTEPETTASITTTRCIAGHVTVIEQRDAAVKHLEPRYRLELLRSEDEKQKQLRETEMWNKHWEQQISTLMHLKSVTYDHSMVHHGATYGL